MYSIKGINTTNAGRVGLRLTFSADSVTESSVDRVVIYVPSSSGSSYYRSCTLSGDIGGREILIPTTTFYIYWHTDLSINKYGWKILPLELTTYPDGEGYKDFGSSSSSISPTSVTSVTGINNTLESEHPYANNIDQWWFWDSQMTMGKTTITNEYYIYRDDIEDKSVKLNSPKLDLQENAAGQLTFKMTPSNRGYNLVDRLTTVFAVYRNNEEIWCGRIISIKEDFYKNKTITCEGELAYLNDTTQPQELYSNIYLSSLMTTFLNIHNSKVDTSKKFKCLDFMYDTTSSATDSYDEVYTNYETTWAAINDKILGISNGYFTLTKDRTSTIPNIIKHRPYTNRDTCTQVIRFGKNLLDFTKNYDATQFCTVILPLGARLDDKYGISLSGIDGVSKHTTIESVNGGSMYYKNDTMVAAYGWIEQVVHWDDEENPELLLQKAKEYLEDIQYDVMTLEVKAIDLNHLDVDYSQMRLSQRVRVISEPHGLDKYFPITKISIPLDNPANASFTLGIESIGTMTSRNIKKNSELVGEIHDTSKLKISEALDDARKEAGDLISDFTTGYVTITQSGNNSQELYVTQQPIPKDYNASNPTGNTNLDGYWRWNYHGLEYVNVKNNREEGKPDNYPQVAIDMTGAINASMINSGKLNAGIIQAGILKNYYWSDSDTSNVVILKFSSDSVVENNNDYIYVYVYDESTGKYRSTLKITGEFGPLTLWVPYDNFYIYFHTDSSTTKYGWKIESISRGTYSDWETQKYWHFPNTVDKLPTYTTKFNLEGSNSLPQSSHYYSNNTDCLWEWHTNLLHQNVFYLDLENGILKMNATSLAISGSTVASQEYAHQQYTKAVEDASTNTAAAINTYDTETLTQKKVFNKLTNNGQAKGIYLEEKELYINATYIKSGTIEANYIYGGTLTLGGASNANGIMNVKNSSGNTIIDVTVDGLSNYTTYNGIDYKVMYAKSGYLWDIATETERLQKYFDSYIGYYTRTHTTDNSTSFDVTPYAYIGIGGSSVRYPSLFIVNNKESVEINSHKEINLFCNDDSQWYKESDESSAKYKYENHIGLKVVSDSSAVSKTNADKYWNAARFQFEFTRVRIKTSNEKETKSYASSYIDRRGYHGPTYGEHTGNTEGTHTGSLVVNSDDSIEVSGNTGLSDSDFWSINSNGLLYKHSFTKGILTRTDYNYSYIEDKLDQSRLRSKIGGLTDNDFWSINSSGTCYKHSFTNGILTSTDSTNTKNIRAMIGGTTAKSIYVLNKSGSMHALDFTYGVLTTNYGATENLYVPVFTSNYTNKVKHVSDWFNDVYYNAPGNPGWSYWDEKGLTDKIVTLQNGSHIVHLYLYKGLVIGYNQG